MRALLRFCLDRPIAVAMVTLALVIIGWRSWNRLEYSLLPNIEYPEYYIITEFKGGAPEEIEKHITVPLEEILSSLPGIRDVISHSREGLSIVEAQFAWNIDYRFTLLRIREKIDAVRHRFPEGTDRPFILDFNPGSSPVMELVLQSESGNLVEATRFAEDVLKPRFSQLDGIAGARITGGQQETIQILLQPEKMLRYNVPLATVLDAVRQNLGDHTFSSRVLVGYEEYPLTVQITIDDQEDFLEIPIVPQADSPLRLKHIAQVIQAPEPQRSSTWLNDSKVIGVSLFKESGANTAAATANATTLITQLMDEFPGFQLEIIKDRGIFVTRAIGGLQQSILIGGFLAGIILFLFLKNARIAIILITVVPISILVTSIVMFMQGLSLNIMSLGGLALGVGLIVDNGIVMSEAIAREIDSGKSDTPVAKGAISVSRAIIGATLTTIAIFFPIIYVRGYASILFQNQAYAITYTLLVSLFAALILIPTAIHFYAMHGKSTRGAVRFDPGFTEESKLHSIGSKLFWQIYNLARSGLQYIYRGTISILSALFHPVSRIFDKSYDAVERVYHRILNHALDHKSRAGLIAIALIIVAYGLFTVLPKQYWPSGSSRYVELEIAVPMTFPTAIIEDATAQTIRLINELPEVNKIITHIQDPTDLQSGDYSQAFEPADYYTIRLLIILANPIDDIEQLRGKLTERIVLPQDHIYLRKAGELQEEFVSHEKKNFVLYLSGDDTTQVAFITGQVRDYLVSLPDCQNVSIESGNAGVVQLASPNLFAMARAGVSSSDISQLLSVKTTGEYLGDWQKGNHKIPVHMYWENVNIKELSHLLETAEIMNNRGTRMSNLLHLQADLQDRDITRVNRRRVVSIQADVPPYKLSSVVDDVQAWLKAQSLQGIEVSISGESRRVADSFAEMGWAFLLAVVIVYLLLAAQFESLIHPLNIILTVPMGVMGAIFGLTIFGQSLNVISLIGIIMMVGIGVNDAIIKVDYMNHLRRVKGISARQAVLQTSDEKFRPVMMTSLTTIFAMLPLLLGLGGNTEFNQPLAAALIGGLIFTTALTLVFTPILYEVFDTKSD